MILIYFAFVSLETGADLTGLLLIGDEGLPLLDTVYGLPLVGDDSLFDSFELSLCLAGELGFSLLAAPLLDGDFGLEGVVCSV